MRAIRSTLAVLVMLALAATTDPRAPLGGQDVAPSPVAENESTPPSADLDVLASQATGNGQALWLLRLVFAPEASLAFRANSGATVALIEAGKVGFTVVVGTAWIRTTDDRLVSARRAELATETVLRPGATVRFGRDALHLFRNAGHVPASVLLTALAPADQPPYSEAVSTDGQPVGWSDAREGRRPG